MACHHSLLLFLLVVTTAAFATNAVVADNMTHLHFYMHDVLGGPNRTAVVAVNGTVPLPSVPGINFGNIVVIDDLLTEGPDHASAQVGRAQGFYMSAALQEPSLLVLANFVLAADGPYNGSTLSVMGPDLIAASVRELSVVGGSGQFRMARGYVLWKTYAVNNATDDAILDLDFYVTTSSNSGSPAGTSSASRTTPTTTTTQSSGSTSASRRIESAVRRPLFSILIFLLIGIGVV